MSSARTNQTSATGFRVLVVNYPFTDKVGQVALTNFIRVLEPIVKEIFVIAGDFSYKSNKKVHTLNIKGLTQKESMPRWVFKQILIELKTSLTLLKISKSIDLVIFYLGGRTQSLAVLLAKLLKKKVVVEAGGSAPKTTGKIYQKMLFGIGGVIISHVSRVLEKISYTFSDMIAVAKESESLIHQLELRPYRRKISTMGIYLLDTNLFKIKKKLTERENIIGYVGRLSREKGVLELAKAIPLILSKRKDVRFLVVGEGLLMNDIKKELEKTGCLDEVNFTGFVSQENVPNYLNEMKIHVLPSYTEAFGGTAIEAMACGTISIANSVGGLPDVIKDDETGFLLKNNRPETIANKVIEVLYHPELERIQKNARAFVEENFGYKKAIERNKQILSNLLVK